MRLLNINDTGEHLLYPPVSESPPPYAILSHTWVNDDDVELARNQQKMDTQDSQSRETTREELKRRLRSLDDLIESTRRLQMCLDYTLQVEGLLDGAIKSARSLGVWNEAALRVFSTLVCMGKSPLIKDFVDSSLTDAHLPLQRMDMPIRSRNRNSRPHQKVHIHNRDGSMAETKEPRNYTDDSRDCGLWDTPYEGKWKLQPDQNLANDCILPLVPSERLNSRAYFLLCDAGGGTVDIVTYKIMQTQLTLELGETSITTSARCGSAYIDADFKQLLQKVIGQTNYRALDPKSGEASIYPAFDNLLKGQRPNDFAGDTFVLKTYDTSMAELSYTREAEAFRGLQLCSLNSHLKFHGSCTRDATYYMPFKYYDLEEFFPNEIPAAHTRSITQFWEDMFKLVDALKDVHKLNLRKGHSMYNGRHGDIKPENILWFNDGPHPHGCSVDYGNHGGIKPENILSSHDESQSQGCSAYYGRHGDIKPENILRFHDESHSRGILTLADLGVSKFARTAANPRHMHKAFGPGEAFPAYTSEREGWKTFPLQPRPRLQDQQQRANKDKMTKRLGTRRLVEMNSHMLMLMQAWFMALTGCLLSITTRKARPKAHGMQAMIMMSMLLWTSPVAATSVEKGGGPHCSSLLCALHLSLNTQLKLFITPQPPYPRSFPNSILVQTTFWATTITVLLYTLLSSRAHTKKFLLFGILVSAAAGAVLAKDVPDLVFRYLFLGTNAALILSALAGKIQGSKQVEKERGVMDVETGHEKRAGVEMKMGSINY